MDKFVVETPVVSLTKKASSHLLPNLTALDLTIEHESTPQVRSMWTMD